MSKLFKKDNGIRYQLDDTNTGEYTTIPYMVETILTAVGTDINVSNPIDPNMDDFTIDWTLVSSPVTVSAQELVDLMYCWISDELPNVITMLTDTPVVFDADCNALQNFNNQLYWRGQLLSGGGGGGIATADNGLNLSTPTNVQLGGPLVGNTLITVNEPFTFNITSPFGESNTSFFMFPGLNPNEGWIGMSGSAGNFSVNAAEVKMEAGLTSKLLIGTPGVTGATAIGGQVLTLIDPTTGECEYKNGFIETVVDIDALAMANLGTSGAIILPNLAGGQYYDIHSIIMEFTPNTTPYTMAGIGSLQLVYGTSGVAIDNQFILGFSDNVVMIKDPIKTFGSSAYNYVDTQAGDALILTTDTNVDPAGGGDGTIRVIIRYNERTHGVI